MMKLTKLIVTVATSIISLTSCQKEVPAVTTPTPSKKQLLTAKVWVVDEVKETQNGTSVTLYKRGATNNTDDFSLVRNQYKNDGSIVWRDEFGDEGNDGRWELLNNDTQLKLSWPIANMSVTVHDVTVTANSFSYKLIAAPGIYTTWKFIPQP
jgi:hypothetical protein